MTKLYEEAAILLTEVQEADKIQLHNKNVLDLWVLDEEQMSFSKPDVETDYGYSMPDNLVELFCIPNGCALEWSKAEYLSGEFKFDNIYDAYFLGDNKLYKKFKTVLEDNDVSEEVQEMFKRARYFDFVSNYGFACLMRGEENDFNLDEVWLMDEDQLRFFKLDLNLETYYRTALTVKGGKFWQYLFYFEEWKVKFYYENICRWIHVLPELFPNHDYSLVMTRFKMMVEKFTEYGYNAPEETISKLKDLGLY